MKYPTLIGFVLLFPALAGAADLPVCATKAATDFAIPVKLFTALVIQARNQPPQIDRRTGKSGEFGPMKLSQKAIERAAPALRTTAEIIRQDPCENYRAAAWWLNNLSVGKKSTNMWSAVNRYFYRARPQNGHGALMNNEVKRIYGSL